MRLFALLFGRKKDSPVSRVEPGAALPDASVQSVPVAPVRSRISSRVVWREGSFPMEVVGELSYQKELIAIYGRHTRYGH